MIEVGHGLMASMFHWADELPKLDSLEVFGPYWANTGHL